MQAQDFDFADEKQEIQKSPALASGACSAAELRSAGPPKGLSLRVLAKS